MRRAHGYQAYLLRIWQTDETAWRAVLEDPHTGARRAFASVECLSAFLSGAPDRASGAPSENPPGGSSAEGPHR